MKKNKLSNHSSASIDTVAGDNNKITYTDLSPRHYIVTIIITMVIMSLFLIFVGQFVRVNGSSMFPTYHSNEILFVEKISRNYKRFDVVTLNANNTLLIKRVIGVPGDTLQIIDGKVYINHKQLDDYVDIQIQNAGIASEEITLDDNQYFVMGDNRNESQDSRSPDIGVITNKQIFGRVLFK